MPIIRLGFQIVRDEERERHVLWLDDAVEAPSVFLLPGAIVDGLSTLSGEAVQGVADWDADEQFGYGLRLRRLLMDSPAMLPVRAFLEGHLTGAAGALNLLIGTAPVADQECRLPFGGIAWELLAGMQGRQSFDALERQGCVARMVQRVRQTSLSVAGPSSQLGVVIWCPQREEEPLRLAYALQDHMQSPQVRAVSGPVSDVSELSALIESTPHPIILHIVAHGERDRYGKTSLLFADGPMDPVRLESMLLPFREHLRARKIVGVVLDACHGAGGDADGRGWGIGERLVRFGFPFAVAAEGPLQLNHAARWAQAFYSVIGDGASLFEAPTHARIQVHRSTGTTGGWCGNRLYVTSLRPDSARSWLQAPLLSAPFQVVGRPPPQRLTEVMRTEHEAPFKDFQARLKHELDRLSVDGVRCGEKHVRAVEDYVHALLASFDGGPGMLSSAEAFVLMLCLWLYPLGWPLLSTSERARARWPHAVAALRRLAEGGTPESTYAEHIKEMLHALRSASEADWPDILRTLELFDSPLPLRMPWSDDSHTPGVRHEMLASLVRLGIALDSGRHRIIEVGRPVASEPSLEAWRHACIGKCTVRGGVVRFAFQVPTRAAGRVVEHAIASDAWQDGELLVDTLSQAGARLNVLAPEIEERAGDSMLRYEDGRIARCPGLRALLASRLQPNADFASLSVSEPDQSPYAVFSLTGVDDVLRIPWPPGHTGHVTLQVRELAGQVIVERRLGMSPSLLIAPCTLGLPEGKVFVWQVIVHRLLRSDAHYRGYFCLLPESRRLRLAEHLATIDALPSGHERTLAQASAYRAHGCWSHALMTLTDQANREGKDEEEPMRYSLFAAMLGVYERMARALRELPGSEDVLQELASHVRAVWAFRHAELQVLNADQTAAANAAADRMLSEAGL